jgi:hypothetical protein
MMTISEMITLLGGDAIVSSHVGCSPITIRSWRHRDSIPPEVFPQIVALAKKRRVPGVTFDSLYSMRKARA